MVDHVLTDMNEYVSYGYSSSHQALDIVGEGNNVSDIMAFDDGVVEIAVNNVMYTDHNTSGNATYGNFIKIKHLDGHKTLYAHLKYDSLMVKTGDSVSKGQKIATMGNTGNAYGTHLHFEVRNSNESRENPTSFLNGSSKITKPASVEIKSNPQKEVKESVNNENEVIKQQEPKKEDTLTIPKDVIIKDDDVPVLEEEKKEVNNNLKTYIGNKNYTGGSIVDGLKGINCDSSFDYRTKLAMVNGIADYRGSYSQNVYLLSLLKSGKLIKA